MPIIVMTGPDTFKVAEYGDNPADPVVRISREEYEAGIAAGRFQDPPVARGEAALAPKPKPQPTAAQGTVRQSEWRSAPKVYDTNVTVTTAAKQPAASRVSVSQPASRQGGFDNYTDYTGAANAPTPPSPVFSSKVTPTGVTTKTAPRTATRVAPPTPSSKATPWGRSRTTYTAPVATSRSSTAAAAAKPVVSPATRQAVGYVLKQNPAVAAYGAALDWIEGLFTRDEEPAVAAAAPAESYDYAYPPYQPLDRSNWGRASYLQPKEPNPLVEAAPVPAYGPEFPETVYHGTPAIMPGTEWYASKDETMPVRPAVGVTWPKGRRTQTVALVPDMPSTGHEYPLPNLPAYNPATGLPYEWKESSYTDMLQYPEIDLASADRMLVRQAKEAMARGGAYERALMRQADEAPPVEESMLYQRPSFNPATGLPYEREVLLGVDPKYLDWYTPWWEYPEYTLEDGTGGTVFPSDLPPAPEYGPTFTPPRRYMPADRTNWGREVQPIPPRRYMPADRTNWGREVQPVPTPLYPENEMVFTGGPEEPIPLAPDVYLPYVATAQARPSLPVQPPRIGLDTEPDVVWDEAAGVYRTVNRYPERYLPEEPVQKEREATGVGLEYMYDPEARTWKYTPQITPQPDRSGFSPWWQYYFATHTPFVIP